MQKRFSRDLGTGPDRLVPPYTTQTRSSGIELPRFARARHGNSPAVTTDEHPRAVSGLERHRPARSKERNLGLFRGSTGTEGKANCHDLYNGVTPGPSCPSFVTFPNTTFRHLPLPPCRTSKINTRSSKSSLSTTSPRSTMRRSEMRSRCSDRASTRWVCDRQLGSIDA